MTRRKNEFAEDLNLIRDVKKARRKSENGLRTASFAQDDKRNIGRVNLIDIIKAPKIDKLRQDN